MELLELLRNRRSVRKFKDVPVEPEKVELLKEAILRSPSSKNKRPWLFVFVRDRDKIKALSEAKDRGGQFLAGAPLALVVAADEGESDVWVEDASVACTIAHLAAFSLGLGSCWVQVRNRFRGERPAEEIVREVLGLPDRYRVEAIVAIGYPDEAPKPVDKADLPYDRVLEI